MNLKKKGCVVKKKLSPGPAVLSCDCTERCRIVRSSHNSVCPTLHFQQLILNVKEQVSWRITSIFALEGTKKIIFNVGNEGEDIYDDDDDEEV